MDSTSTYGDEFKEIGHCGGQFSVNVKTADNGRRTIQFSMQHSKYIRDSGDISVRPKQFIRETSETASKIADLVLRIPQNIHNGFHAIFSPEDRPIRIKQEHARYLAKTGHSK